MNMYKRLVLNTLSQLSSRTLIVAMTFLATVMLRRYFGRDVYGIYIYALNLVTLIITATDLGTYLTGVREAQDLNKTTPKIMGYTIYLRGFMFLICAALLIIFIRLIPNPLPADLTPYILLLVCVLLLKDCGVAVYHALEKLHISSLINTISSSATLVSALVVVSLGLAIKELFLIQIAIAAMVVIGLTLIMKRKALLDLTYPGFKVLWTLFKDSLPLGGVLILFTVYSRIDTVIIGAFLGETEVGAYGLAYKIYDNLVLPAAFLANAFLPIAAKLYQQNSAQLRVLVQRLAVVMVATSLTGIVLVWLIAPLVLPLLTGDTAGIEIVLTRILSLALVFAFLNHLVGYLVIVFKRQKLSLPIAGIALVVNVVLNWIFIPKYGLMTAAVITIITEAVVLMLNYWVVVRPHLKFYETHRYSV